MLVKNQQKKTVLVFETGCLLPFIVHPFGVHTCDAKIATQLTDTTALC